MALASLAYSPTTISFAQVLMPYSESKLKDCFEAAHDERTNPFRDFFTQILIPRILSTDPDVVGISVTATTQLIPTITLATLIKEEAPHVHITLGGNTLSRFADEPHLFTKLFDIIDSIVLFDGEPALDVLLEHLESGHSLEDVPNLVTCHEGRVRRSPITLFADINGLPTPSFAGLDLEQYFFPEPVLPVLTGRGCYWHRCAFCTHTIGYGKAFRPRTVGHVMKDLADYTENLGVKLYYFCDECIEPAWLETLCNRLIEEDLQVRWMMEARLEQEFTPELCRKLYQAGCRMLAFGLESGCQRVLDLMNKGTKKEYISQTLQNSSDAGIWNHVCIIVGFPTETCDEARETLEFLKENKKNIGSAIASSFLLELDSKIYLNPETYGITKILHHKDKDFQFVFDYDAYEKMNKEETKEIWKEFQETIEKEGLLPIEYGGFLLPLMDDHEEVEER
jgi:radical SAM superfamily enzyme YgiQ (UPF0313 family)